MPDHRFVVADVFTDRPFTGNQLAVFTDARELDAETMQALALTGSDPGFPPAGVAELELG